MKKTLILLWILTLLLSLTSCAREEREESAPLPEECRLVLDGRRYTYVGDPEGLRAEGDRLIICRGGTYRISGTLREGAILVDVSHTEVVRLILEGVSITSSYHPPIAVKSAACLILETAKDSVNLLTDAPRTAEGAPLPSACLSVNSNLRIQGEGSLTVSGRAACALSSSGTVILGSGGLTLSAPETALWVRDALIMEGGALTVTHARYGIVTDDSPHAAGTVTVRGGRLVAVCSEIAISSPHPPILAPNTTDLRVVGEVGR